MSTDKVIFKEKIIKENLSYKANTIELCLYDTVSSTNDLIKSYAKGEAHNDMAIIASNQTAGRGRLDRKFFSPEGCGIYMSVLLHPNKSPNISALLTSAAAVAVAEAIEAVCGVHTDIKWINDIYLNKKKLCGILCEASISAETGLLDYAIVGIGINLLSPPDGFPEEISRIATSLFESKLPDDNLPNRLCAEIINKLYEYAYSLDECAFLEEYKKRMFVLGKEITVHSPEGQYQATAAEIDDECRLIVTLPDKAQKVLSYGEISIRF